MNCYMSVTFNNTDITDARLPVKFCRVCEDGLAEVLVGDRYYYLPVKCLLQANGKPFEVLPWGES